MSRPQALYLDLMKRSLTHWIYASDEVETLDPRPWLRPEALTPFHHAGLRLVQPRPFDPDARAHGRDWPPTAHTMIGLKRLDNLQVCIEEVLQQNIPGDLMETGAWRGGATIFMRAVLQAHGVTNRRVWVADSFAGLPPPNAQKYPHDAGLDLHQHTYLAVSLEQVKANFDRYGLLDDQVVFVEGWFRDTLPACAVERLAVLRLDGDLYESTIEALTFLYPKVSRGGYVIIDDFGNVAACRQAVTDYRTHHRLQEPIQAIDGAGVYWQKAN